MFYKKMMITENVMHTGRHLLNGKCRMIQGDNNPANKNEAINSYF